MLRCEITDTVHKLIQNYALDLNGMYQSKNLCTVLNAKDILAGLGFVFTDEGSKDALRNVKKLTGLRGRWDVVATAPNIILDVAHNADGLGQLLEQIALVKQPGAKCHFILGFVKDKDLNTILPLLPVDALYYIAAPAIQRGLDPLVFIEQAKRYNLFCNHYESVNEAFKAAKKQAKKEDLVFIGGSNFVVAEVV